MVKKAMDSGYIGDINFVEFYRGSSSLAHESASPFFWDPLEAGGGAMMDYGCHAVTLAMFLAGFKAKVLSVKSTGISRVFRNRPLRGLMQEIHVDDDVHVKVLFEDPEIKNCIITSFQAGWVDSLKGTGRDYDCYFRVIGNEGEITGGEDEEGKQFIKVEKYGYGYKRLDVPPPITGVIEEMMNGIISFLRSLKDGKEPFTNVDYGLKNMAIMGAAYLSELRGRVSVTLEEFQEFCENIASKCKKDEEVPVAIIKSLMKPYQ